MSDDLLRKYEAELARLEGLMQDLDRAWARTPRLFAFLVLTPVAWYMAGFAWAVVYVLCVFALVGSKAYLLKVRRDEDRASHQLIARDLEQLRAKQAQRTTS